MPRYEVRILTKNGPKAVLIDGPSKDYVTKIGARQGRVASVTLKRGFDIIPGMTGAERYIWLMRMSSMVTAKVSTTEALKLMMTTFGGTIKKASTSMLGKVEAGMDIAAAMEQDPRNFPVTTTALMRAGIAGGDTGRAMRDVAEFEYKLSTAQKGSMKDVYNALGSFFIAFALMVATTRYFGPMVMDNPMFKHAKGVDVEWARTTGEVCTDTMIALTVILVFFGWLGTIGRRLLPDIADNIILKIPFYKDLILSKNNHVTLYKLGLLVNSGVRIEESLQITEDSAPRGALKTDLKRALAAMRSGKPWATAMKTLHATDKAALATSSDRADVARTLGMLAQQYADLYIQRIQAFAPTLGMIAAIFMTLAGGILFAQTILPMLQLAAAI
jgi:general secretion pathway protein F